MITWLGRIGVVVVLICYFYVVRPSSRLHNIRIDLNDFRQKIALGLVLLLTLFFIVWPMSINPIWNGEIPEWRNQYELIAQSFLEGRLDFGYEVDPKLMELQNPYDPGARRTAEATFYWDHAYYEGKYYMYFGVVPVILLFLPFLAITGASLPTYIATAIFCSVFTIGIFYFLLILSKRHFSNSIGFVTYLCLSFSLSFISTCYCIKYPALYCTAISAAIAFALWGCIFWYASLNADGSWDKWKLLLGSFCFALVFGCRPHIGIVAFVAAPFLLTRMKRKQKFRQILREVAFLIIPFMIVAPGIMWYNHARFGSIFQFGAIYNLTVINMITYKAPIISYFSSLIQSFISANITNSFPYISYSGVFFQFPILLSIFTAIDRKTACIIKSKQLVVPLVFLYTTAIAFCIIDNAVAGFSYRYTTDFCWLCSLAAFLHWGCLLDSLDGTKFANRIKFLIAFLSLLSVVACFLLFFVVADTDISYTHPEITHSVYKFFMVWK